MLPMRLLRLISWAAVAASVGAGAGVSATLTKPAAASTAGVEALVQRRLPEHRHKFEFALVNTSGSAEPGNDTYRVSSTSNGKFLIQGNTMSALLSG